MITRRCENCKEIFTAKHPKARYCNIVCGQRKGAERLKKANYRMPVTNAQAVGKISTYRVMTDLMAKGRTIYKSISVPSPCDLLLIDKNGKIKRIDIHTAMVTPTGKWIVSMPKRENIDVYALITQDGKIKYEPESIDE